MHSFVSSCCSATRIAQQVLSLLDLGLVDKEEVAAYYDALSNLERTTQEAKEATLAASLNPRPTSNRPFSTATSEPEGDPLSLIPFPAICAFLGFAGTKSLHLTGDLDNVASACGAIAGAGIGSLVVVGQDPVARVARTIGSAIIRSAGAAGGVAGKSVSESVVGAAGAAVAAAEQAIIKAPVNMAGALVRSLLDSLSAAAGSVVRLPGELARKTVVGATGALRDTSEAAVNLPGDIARKAVDAAGGAIQSTSEAAITAVTEAPKEAAKRLTEVVSSPGEALTSAVSSATSTLAEGSKGLIKVSLLRIQGVERLQ